MQHEKHAGHAICGTRVQFRDTATREGRRHRHCMRHAIEVKVRRILCGPGSLERAINAWGWRADDRIVSLTHTFMSFKLREPWTAADLQSESAVRVPEFR